MRFRAFAASAAGLLSVSFAAAQLPPGFRVETVVTGLDKAVAMAFAPDGRIFVAERLAGRVRVVKDGVLDSATWATVPSSGTEFSEFGTIGIAVSPRFLGDKAVFVHYITPEPNRMALIGRYTEVGGVGTGLTLVGPQIAVTAGHVGGPLRFGRDGALWIARGDGMNPALAQTTTDPYGKILRMLPSGAIPTDNPFATTPGGQYIWSYGNRNVFGLSVHPDTGVLYATENGADLVDEVNRIVAGKNYGWPLYEGDEPVPDPATEDPLWTVPPSALTGAAFYAGSRYPAAYRNTWFIGDWWFGKITQLTLDASGTMVVASAGFHQFDGPVFDVVDGPDGNLYVLHSDAAFDRGADRISRIVYDPTPKPSLNLAPTAQRAIGGSLTLGAVGTTGDRVAAWFGFSVLPVPVPLPPWGDLWIPPELVLPEFTLTGDDRGYFGVRVPELSSLVGQSIYTQAAVLSGATLTLTDWVEYVF